MKVIRIIFMAMAGTFVFSANVFAQTDSVKKSSNDVYEIKLKDPVKCIQLLEYEKTAEPIKGYLDVDRTKVYLENYKVNNRVKLKVIYENGREEEILRSPCSIELKYQL